MVIIFCADVLISPDIFFMVMMFFPFWNVLKARQFKCMSDSEVFMTASEQTPSVMAIN